MALFWNGSELQSVVVNGTAYDNVFVDGVQVIGDGGGEPPPSKVYNPFITLEDMYNNAAYDADETVTRNADGSITIDMPDNWTGPDWDVGRINNIKVIYNFTISDMLDGTSYMLQIGTGSNNQGAVRVTFDAAGDYTGELTYRDGTSSYVGFNSNPGGQGPFTVTALEIRASEDQSQLEYDTSDQQVQAWVLSDAPNAGSGTWTWDSDNTATVEITDVGPDGYASFELVNAENPPAASPTYHWIFELGVLEDCPGVWIYNQHLMKPIVNAGHYTFGTVNDLWYAEHYIYFAAPGTYKLEFNWFPITTLPATIMPVEENNNG